MESLKNFKSNSLNMGSLSKICGGFDEVKTEHMINGVKVCDVHHDDNNNSRVDAGECVDIVECEK